MAPAKKAAPTKKAGARPATAQTNSTFASRAGKGDPVTAFGGNTTFAERAGKAEPADDDPPVPPNGTFADRAKDAGADKKVDPDDTTQKSDDDPDDE